MKRPMIPVAVICIVIALLRGVIFDREMAREFVPENGQRCSLEGKVYHKTDDSIYLQDIILILEDAHSGCQTIHLKYNLICKTTEAAGLKLGSVLYVEGSFKLYDEAMNPGEFDVRRFYDSMGIKGYLTTAYIIEEGEGFDLLSEGLWWCKERLRERMKAVFPSRESGTLSAMLLGDRQDLDTEVKAMYKDAGVAHILAISGLHITLLGVGLYKVLRKCRMTPGLAALGGIMIMLTYGLMTGLGVSCCRAVGMYSLRMYSKIRRRTTDMLTSLCIVGAVMVFINPLYLRQTSFQLSFASVCGVALMNLLEPKQDKRKGAQERYDWGILRRREGPLKERAVMWAGLVGVKLWRALRSSLLVSICICLVSLPIQLVSYYKIPLYSVTVNLLVLPVMSLVAGCTLVALIPGLGVVGTGACLALDYVEGVCNACGRLNGLIWNPRRPANWQIICYYGILLAIVTVIYLSKRKLKARKWSLLWLGGLMLPTLIFGVERNSTDRVAFLYVGQGDCTVIERATGETYIYDCGSSTRSGVGTNVLIPFLLYEGRSHIDYVFVSHGDSDHDSGVLELLQKAESNGIEINALVLPSLQSKILEQEFGELVLAAGEAGVRVMTMSEGACIDDIEAFHPSRDYVPESDNASSLCLLVNLGSSKTLLLTGDVDGTGETELVERLVDRLGRNMDIDILKVSHHGSRYSTGDAFLGAVKPKLAVIMAGRNNSYGHPHKETLERLENVGATVKNTALEGAVIIDIE